MEIKMDKKSKILLLVFFVCLIISIFMTYNRTMIKKDFSVTEISYQESE